MVRHCVTKCLLAIAQAQEQAATRSAQDPQLQWGACPASIPTSRPLANSTRAEAIDYCLEHLRRRTESPRYGGKSEVYRYGGVRLIGRAILRHRPRLPLHAVI